MAKHGFKVFDSDMHIMEPPDLWERYIAREFKSEAPRGRTSDNVRDLGLIFPGGEGNVNRTAATPHRGHNFEKNQRIYRDHSERGCRSAACPRSGTHCTARGGERPFFRRGGSAY